MRTNRAVLFAAILIISVLVSSVAILAQDSTPESTAESTAASSSFTDGRINGDIFLGGLAIYCQDQNGNTNINTFQNGGLTVWGPNGQEYIFLSANQLRGNQEVPQLATMEVNMTETVAPTATQTATMSASGTQEAQQPFLLAQANTVNGPIWLFRVGDDQFALQGNDNTGKFFTYVWTGCSIGTLSTDTASFANLGTNNNTSGQQFQSTQDVTSTATQAATTQSSNGNATAESTTSP